MSLTSREIYELLYKIPWQKISNNMVSLREEKGIREDSCLYCGKRTNLGGMFCTVVSSNNDTWIDCAEEFYKENLHLLLEWITE